MFTADMAEPIEMTCKNKMTVFPDSRAHFLPNKLQEFNEQFTGPTENRPGELGSFIKNRYYY